jgi:hypothetical protein
MPCVKALAASENDGLAARRREHWIEDRGYIDTLITSNLLLETGLTLVSSQVVIFREPEFSLCIY